MDLKLNSDKGGDVTTYVTNGEWDLIGNIHVPSVNIKMLSSMSLESFACMCMSSTYHPRGKINSKPKNGKLLVFELHLVEFQHFSKSQLRRRKGPALYSNHFELFQFIFWDGLYK